MRETAFPVRTIVDQVYSRAGGSARLADLFVPESKDPRPAVIWLHGGGWRFGDRHLAPDLAAFAQTSGLAMVSIDYRLSDEAKFPAAVEDVKTAVRWVRRSALDFGIDRNRIGLWGSSAGGHLAGCAALSSEDEFASDEHRGYSSAVQAVVDGYGPINFGRIDSERGASASPGTDAESLGIGKRVPAGHPDSFESRFLGVPVATSPEAVELADPVHYVRSECPPFLILHGKADTLIPAQQSEYLFGALDGAGADATLVLFEKLGHGFFNNRNLSQEDAGIVTVRKSTAALRDGLWSFDMHTDVVSMVRGFLRAHLSSAGPAIPAAERTVLNAMSGSCERHQHPIPIDNPLPTSRTVRK